MASALGPFDVHAVIGRGGEGEVRAGVHRRTGLPVAVKVLRGERWRDPAAVAAFDRETRAVAALDHPHVVTLLDVGAVPAEHDGPLVPGSPYVVMERASGTAVACAGSPWPVIRAILVRLLDALAHAHARGVLHRDVKPANVLLGCRRHASEPLEAAFGGLRLADFGIAWTAQGGRAAGTRHYMAPEQQAHRWWAFGAETDLYAVGGVAWALVTGAPPGPGAPFAPRVAVPAGLAAWIARSRAAEPRDRFRSAAEAALALAALSDADGPGAPAPVLLNATQTFVHLEPLSLATEAERAPPPVVPTDPPLPVRWSQPPAWPSQRLLDAGLALATLRAPPLVGREAERDALWAHLRAARERTIVVHLAGPVGAGRRRLARWLARRANEVGAAAVLEVGPEAPLADGLARLARRPAARGSDAVDVLTAAGPTVLVVDGPVPGVEVLLGRGLPLCVLVPGDCPWPVDAVVPVPPLPDGALDELLRRGFALAPALATALALASDGLPGRAVAAVHRLVAHGALAPGPDGFTARMGAVDDVDPLLDAAQAALADGDVRRANLLAARAAPALSRLPDDDRRWARWLELRVRAYVDDGLGPDGRIALADALLARAEAHGWPAHAASALLHRALNEQNSGRDALPTFDRALAAAEAARSPLVGQIRTHRGFLHLFGRSDAPAARADFAVVADGPDRATGLYGLTLVETLHGDAATAVARGREALDQAGDHPVVRSRAEEGLANALVRVGALDEAIGLLGSAGARVATIPMEHARILNSLGSAHLHAGALDRAADCFLRAQARGQDVGTPPPQAVVGLAMVTLARGERERLAALVAQLGTPTSRLLAVAHALLRAALGDRAGLDDAEATLGDLRVHVPDLAWLARRIALTDAGAVALASRLGG